MFDEARPICVVSLDLDPHGWNHLLFCQNYCQSSPSSSQQFSQGTSGLSGPISSISDHSTRVTAENEIAEIFGRKYFDILSSVPLSHYDTARRIVDIISPQLAEN